MLEHTCGVDINDRTFQRQLTEYDLLGYRPRKNRCLERFSIYRHDNDQMDRKSADDLYGVVSSNKQLFHLTDISAR